MHSDAVAQLMNQFIAIKFRIKPINRPTRCFLLIFFPFATSIDIDTWFQAPLQSFCFENTPEANSLVLQKQCHSWAKKICIVTFCYLDKNVTCIFHVDFLH